MDDARQMSAFVAAADELHLGRAADRLGVHPATVASRLRALESRIGLVLVDRSHRCRIAMTQAGVALLPVARRVVDAMAAFEEQSADVRSGVRGVVRVALTSEDDDGTKALVDELRRVDPAWEVSVERMGVRAAGRALAVGAVECSIGRGGLSPRAAPGPFDPRPNRLEPTRLARIRPAPEDAEARSGRARDLDRDLVVAWRTAWELAASSQPMAHAQTLVARVRRLRFLAGGRRTAAAHARRQAIARRAHAVDAERRLIAEETARYGFTEAAARAAVREREEVLRRVADARARGEPLGLHLAMKWLVLRFQDAGDGEPPQE